MHSLEGGVQSAVACDGVTHCTRATPPSVPIHCTHRVPSGHTAQLPASIIGAASGDELVPASRAESCREDALASVTLLSRVLCADASTTVDGASNPTLPPHPPITSAATEETIPRTILDMLRPESSCHASVRRRRNLCRGLGPPPSCCLPVSRLSARLGARWRIPDGLDHEGEFAAIDRVLPPCVEFLGG